MQRNNGESPGMLRAPQKHTDRQLVPVHLLPLPDPKYTLEKIAKCRQGAL